MARWMAVALACWVGLALPARAGLNPREYEPVSQTELIANKARYQGKKVQVTGVFLFTGSDFCYQIRKTKINTRDYFCFALGTPSLVRMYLKKDHPQADELLNLRKGTRVTAFGTFDYLGADYNYMLVDGFRVEGSE